MMIEWVIWYDDGNSFTNEDGEPHEAPRWGVLAVAARSKDHGRVIWHGKDYYVWEAEWLGVDFIGLVDYLTRPGREKFALVGRGVRPARFHEIYNQAVADPRLPVKTSSSHLEEIQ